eukprot:CAMPEP_0117615048 /NCGR_PEP_ID=MMETSP0784-20121206/84345_1 /TAXON_ID=39447 /ORGANISM="" /LENGTH=213 /DNA_ID=CAMNT_0005418785 /DNA_START=36 /DNA_END=678 /DNA_ORIENTATION=+
MHRVGAHSFSETAPGHNVVLATENKSVKEPRGKELHHGDSVAHRGALKQVTSSRRMLEAGAAQRGRSALHIHVSFLWLAIVLCRNEEQRAHAEQAADGYASHCTDHVGNAGGPHLPLLRAQAGHRVAEQIAEACSGHRRPSEHSPEGNFDRIPEANHEEVVNKAEAYHRNAHEDCESKELRIRGRRHGAQRRIAALAFPLPSDQRVVLDLARE